MLALRSGRALPMPGDPCYLFSCPDLSGCALPGGSPVPQAQGRERHATPPARRRALNQGMPHMAMKYWLLKSEPGCYSIDDLAAEPDQTTCWSGVRNFQARNFLRDQMAEGDLALFYHSVTDPSAVGLVRVARAGYPDQTAWDPDDSHFDPRSTPERPLWFAVDVRLVRKFAAPVPLRAMRVVPALAGLELLRKGSRLSVLPVAREAFEIICGMGAAAGGQ